MKIKFRRGDGKPGNYTASVKTTGGEHEIVFYPEMIKQMYEEGYVFMGIKPDNFSHALKIVLEHEIAHVILAESGKYGHTKDFMGLVSTYGHTDHMVRRGNENTQDPHKNNQKNSG